MKLRFKTYDELVVINSGFNNQTEDIIQRWFGTTINRDLVFTSILGKNIDEVIFAKKTKAYSSNYPVILNGVTKTGVYHIRQEALTTIPLPDVTSSLDIINNIQLSNFLKELNYEEIQI